MKHKLLLEGVTTELLGSRKELGRHKEKAHAVLLQTTGTFWTRRAVKTHCCRMKEYPERVLPYVYLILILLPRGRYCP